MKPHQRRSKRRPAQRITKAQNEAIRLLYAQQVLRSRDDEEVERDGVGPATGQSEGDNET